MESFVCPRKARSRWLKALPVGLSLLLLAGTAGAQNPGTFSVGSGYNGTGVADASNVDPLVNYLPQIYATNFINGVDGLNSTFSISSYTGSPNWLGALYENWYNTLNFTNVGEMDSLTGFNFVTHHTSGADTEAGSFYNSGSINCGTSANAVLLNQVFNVFNGGYFQGYGGINVWATNVSVSDNGVVNIGANGLARFSGNTVGFNTATVTIQSQASVLSGTVAANISASGQVDYNTNQWVPSSSLGQFYADAPMNTMPFDIFLFNSVPYFQINASDNTGTNWTVRMIFLQDNSVNVATNVYFQGGIGNGSAHVEWVGTYTDPASGQTSARYLYLINDYMQGSSTNNLKYGDPSTVAPGNFSFFTSTTPLNLGPATTAGFFNNILDSDTITNNIYSYVDAMFLPTTVATNSQTLGSIALTNLPGRVEINASNELSIIQSAISGMNYLRLNSTNQFDYDGQSQIAAPYSDIYLGNTNGTMAVTNLIQSSLPIWSGNIQAWTTRWIASNTVPAYPGYNFDFRVLLVASQVSPTTASALQDFVLYSTNNVTISDVLNISRTFSLNCTNLLLTTNGLGNGAASPDGELNLQSTAINWATAAPRLRCLTNNGAIRTAASATFGSPSLPYLALFNTGLINNSGNSTLYASDFENYGIYVASAGAIAAQTQTTTMTNATVLATGTISLAANSLVLGGTAIQAGNSLTLIATNLLTDNVTGVTNASNWAVGANYPGFGSSSGLVLPIKPVTGDLLATTITNLAAVGTKTVNNTWAGQDRGYANAGYLNNVAIGQLVLDAQTNGTKFYFTGTATGGATNAIYVDCIQFMDYSSYAYRNGTNMPALSFNTNVVIYYAQALSGGSSVAEKINHWNGDHLRWVPSYAGTFSSVSLVYPDGTTNLVNAALASSTDIDSDRDGIGNASDPTPVLVPSQLNFTLTVTNLPPKSARLSWRTIPLAGNYIYYKTNLLSPVWLPFTNFNNYYYGPGTAVTNAAHTNYFVSPQPYINFMAPADNWEMTNVWVIDPLTNVMHFYRVMVQPN
jgi:hypothetical protein